MEKEIEELKKRIAELEKRPTFVHYPTIIYPPQNPNYYQPWVCSQLKIIGEGLEPKSKVQPSALPLMGRE